MVTRWWGRSPVDEGGVLSDTAVFPWRSGRDADGTVHDEPVATTPVLARPWAVEIGLLLARVVVGAVAVLDGVRALFGLPPGSGAGATRELVAGYGFRAPVELTNAYGWALLLAGVLVVVGVFASFAASALVASAVVVLGVTVPAAWTAGDLGPVQSPLYALALTLVVALAGPGRISGDADRPWHRHQTPVGLTCALIGVMTGLTVLVFLR